jgi:primosomal protein N' (replication factor Y)
MRREAMFPPFIELASFIVSSTDREKAANAAKQLFELFHANPAVNPEMLFGPAPASLEKINERFRFQLLLKMTDFAELTTTVKNAVRQVKKSGDTRISIDINPFFMI